MNNESLRYLNYFERRIAQEVHLNGIESFSDLKEGDQESMLNECKTFLSVMIKKEHVKQYGKRTSL